MKTINISNDYQLSRVQDFVKQEFDSQPTKFPVIDGVFIKASITTTGTTVNHTLARNIVGWIVVRQNANAEIWESGMSNPRPKDQIILLSSAAVDVTIYFF